MSADAMKKAAALQALAYVSSGMALGLGTGSTAAHFVIALGERVRGGLDVTGVPTSKATETLAREHGVPLTTLEETPRLDLTVDGADEISPDLTLIKGGGGALLREKIVAQASREMIVIADSSKLVETLGRFPLPVEVIDFGLAATRRAIEGVLTTLRLQGTIARRLAADGQPFVTDSGHAILDLSLGAIPDPHLLAAALSGIAGVVDHGLFLGLASRAVIAYPDRVGTIVPAGVPSRHEAKAAL